MTGKHVNIRLIVLAPMVCAIAFILISGCGTQQFKSPLFESNDFSGWGPNGMTWNGRDLVIADNKLILDINNIETGVYFGNESSFTNDGFFMFGRSPEPLSINMSMKICGLAWEGECCGAGFLWIADSLNQQLLKIDRKNNAVKHFPSPGKSPNGLAFDGKDLWLADATESKIYRLSTDDGYVIAEYVSPVEEPTGLAWDCQNLWVIGLNRCSIATKDCYQARLLAMDVETGKTVREIDLSSDIVRPASLEWTNGYMWIGDYYQNRVFKISAGKTHAVN